MFGFFKKKKDNNVENKLTIVAPVDGKLLPLSEVLLLGLSFAPDCCPLEAELLSVFLLSAVVAFCAVVGSDLALVSAAVVVCVADAVVVSVFELSVLSSPQPARRKAPNKSVRDSIRNRLFIMTSVFVFTDYGLNYR